MDPPSSSRKSSRKRSTPSDWWVASGDLEALASRDAAQLPSPPLLKRPRVQAGRESRAGGGRVKLPGPLSPPAPQRRAAAGSVRVVAKPSAPSAPEGGGGAVEVETPPGIGIVGAASLPRPRDLPPADRPTTPEDHRAQSSEASQALSDLIEATKTYQRSPRRRNRSQSVSPGLGNGPHVSDSGCGERDLVMGRPPRPELQPEPAAAPKMVPVPATLYSSPGSPGTAPSGVEAAAAVVEASPPQRQSSSSQVLVEAPGSGAIPDYETCSHAWSGPGAPDRDRAPWPWVDGSSPKSVFPPSGAPTAPLCFPGPSLVLSPGQNMQLQHLPPSLENVFGMLFGEHSKQ